MTHLIRVTDEVAEIFESVGHLSRSPWVKDREARIDALLDDVLALQAD